MRHRKRSPTPCGATKAHSNDFYGKHDSVLAAPEPWGGGGAAGEKYPSTTWRDGTLSTFLFFSSLFSTLLLFDYFLLACCCVLQNTPACCGAQPSQINRPLNFNLLLLSRCCARRQSVRSFNVFSVHKSILRWSIWDMLFFTLCYNFTTETVDKKHSE